MKVVNSFLERCAEALEVLVRHRGGMPLGELAGAMAIPKSAAHRLLTGLAGVGWVSQDPETGFYKPTLKLALLGQRMIGSKLPDICQPILDRLAAETRELVRLAVVDNGALVWVAVAQGAHTGIIYQPDTVSRVPLHVSANGKIWLASLSNEDATSLVLQDGFGRKGQYGPGALGTIEALLAELDKTRQQGWGLAWEETEAGIVAVAVPIRPGKDKVVATMSVAGPTLRLSRERIPQLVEQLRDAAAEIEELWPDRR